MKTTYLILTLAALSATPAFSQGGPLTPPPGAPAPTMKTLDQIEPRMPLVAGTPNISVAASGTITINGAGSYYLTAPLDISTNVNGIVINADNVTVDLMDFPIRYVGSGNASTAILINGTDVTVQNGKISSTTSISGGNYTLSGFLRGVSAVGTNRQSVTLKNLLIVGTRAEGIDIDLGRSCLIEDCAISVCGGQGINAREGLVQNCTVRWTGAEGIDARIVTQSRAEICSATAISAIIVADSVGDSIGSAATHHGISGEVVRSSTGKTNGGNGIQATRSITSSYGTSAGLAGIFSENGTVTGSYGLSNGSTTSARGIQAQIVSDSRGQSTNASGGEGIRADTLAMNCVAQSSGTTALYATRAATNCYGFTNATNSSAHGIFSEGSVNNSYGWSNGNGGGDGINAQIITGSYGNTATGARHGINARIVNSSYGRRASSVAGKFGLLANRASLSEGVNGESITHRFDMP